MVKLERNFINLMELKADNRAAAPRCSRRCEPWIKASGRAGCRSPALAMGRGARRATPCGPRSFWARVVEAKESPLERDKFHRARRLFPKVAPLVLKVRADWMDLRTHHFAAGDCGKDAAETNGYPQALNSLRRSSASIHVDASRIQVDGAVSPLPASRLFGHVLLTPSIETWSMINGDPNLVPSLFCDPPRFSWNALAPL